ncbi:NAD(P)-dependent dehydrogenase (short-subunit alcohol dehydrogenase family) [Spinactinospora alkalitolerans]|uniref:NAD(P)-dependent dehydrogenase (Short-subunit alcohol dehydrogenase family) n=1 Tax=Spinactinospora alkalitolerans TaxID=687207 RepID=A0A852TWQ7_9ACTN|nr:SDR family oxidoreductase [Spinactinospora alkalitolerans]NYE47273.1 NAD(P)-dependent dehydrogenase (short-subunit alcohol dehydrogenase family) [Spinactinospora alkalitolerans]
MTQPEAQSQPYPGHTEPMDPHPRDEMRDYTGRGLLEGRTALITGGDSGIGRAVAVAFAKEGADVAIAYLEEDDDARHTASLVEKAGRRCLPMRGDLGDERHCEDVVARTVAEFGGLDVVVPHAATQAPVGDFTELSTEQLTRTYQVNVFSVFWLLRAALPHMPDGGSVVITGSVNGLRGNKSLIDYATSKAAVMNLTYCLAQHYVDRGIRVNCVAPGPVWTPLIPSTLPENKVEGFGGQAPMQRAAHPDEIAPSYVFFASGRLSSYYSGEVLAPIGGEIQSS